MSDGQYIRIDELVLLTGFVLLIPATLATFVQILMFVKLRAWQQAPKTAILGVIANLIGGLALSVLLMALAPQSIVQYVGIREVPILGRSITVFPLALLAFGISTLISTLWATRRARIAA